MIQSVEQVIRLLAEADYVAEESLATAVYLAFALQKPLLLEGEPGVGKTELALTLAQARDRELIRLQCYEGLDAGAALYEWNYPKQILRIKLEELAEEHPDDLEAAIFSEDFLLDRPLLKAIRTEPAPVLLIDELDRADEEFEAFLLEILSDWQVTIPELGVIRAAQPPLTIITSNRTREVHDALKRRCLYHWIGFPDFDKELAVLKARLPELEPELGRQVVTFLQALRSMDLVKKPGLSETLDWARALLALNRNRLEPETVEATLGCLLKYREDSLRAAAALTFDEGLLSLKSEAAC